MQTHTKETSKSALLALCEGNSPGTGEFPAPMTSNAEKNLPFDDVIMVRDPHFVITMPADALTRDGAKPFVCASLSLLFSNFSVIQYEC